MESSFARAIWHRLEAINAVTYFSPECREAPTRLGLKGFWMGYFACRAAPMGPVDAGVVEATFFNFHPTRVRRAIPAAWACATCEEILEVRCFAAAAALRRILSDAGAEALATDVLPVLGAAIEHASTSGRSLFAANRSVPAPTDPVAALWQAATALREHRGDGHVALLTAAELDGCEVHALFAACAPATPELYLGSRGWSAPEWHAAISRLAARNLLRADGTATQAGRDARDGIERRTDELALAPYRSLDTEVADRLLHTLDLAARRVASAGDIAFPNPMGLPRPRDWT